MEDYGWRCAATGDGEAAATPKRCGPSLVTPDTATGRFAARKNTFTGL
jgi:hypothetical protein